MKGMRSGILRGCDRTRQSKDEEGKGLESGRLASAKKYKGCAEFLGIGKLLQIICQRFHKNSKIFVSQISYSLVVILELSGVSEVQYKEIMIIGNKQYQQE